MERGRKEVFSILGDDPELEKIKEQIEAAKAAVRKEDFDPHREEKKLVSENLGNVRQIIAVHSGKGGVGKTFIAVNLAFTLAKKGHKIGLLDADIDCPNVARFLNIDENELEVDEQGKILPLIHKGVKIMSSHFLSLNPEEPMIVRGPIKHGVLKDILSTVEWGELDYLIIDLPPGTSDVPMSTMLLADIDGLIVVTTPQKEALMDAKKSALMARKLNVPIIGIIENMSGDIFGNNAEKLAETLGTQLIASIPLSREIAKTNEEGKIAFEIDSLTNEVSDIINKLSIKIRRRV
jgi:ATP-binding protein involved in chromosome partitioning